MRTTYYLLCLSLALWFFASGCASPPPSALYIVVIDRSESTDPMRLDQLHDITRVRQAALLNNAEMEIWFYDSVARRIYGPSVPNDSKAIKLEKQSYLIPDMKHLKIGTRPAALFEALDKTVPDMSGKDVRLLILTDGDNDFAADDTRIKAGAQALGGVAKLRLTIIGVHPENEKWWRTLVSPAVGGRITLASPADHAQATGQAVAR